MVSNITGTEDQGEILAYYRKSNKMSRAELAELLKVDVSTIYRMEKQSMIKDPQKRQLLVGFLGIPAALMGIDSEQKPITTKLVLNEDRMSFFEDVMTTRWDVYHTGGTNRAYRGLDVWIKEAESFAQETRSSSWYRRGHALLSMSYQLRGSIFRDSMQYKDAHSSYQSAFQVAHELGDFELMASTLARQGVTFIQQKKPNEAIEALGESLNVVNGRGLPFLRGYILQALSEAYALSKQESDSRRNIELAQRTLERRGEVFERSNCYPNTSSVFAQKGVNAVLLGDYEWAIKLIDKSLTTYNHSFIRGRGRLVAQKAEAYFGLGFIDMCYTTAEEALKLAHASGSKKTFTRIEQLNTALSQSKWKQEPDAVRLNLLVQSQKVFM